MALILSLNVQCATFFNVAPPKNTKPKTKPPAGNELNSTHRRYSSAGITGTESGHCGIDRERYAMAGITGTVAGTEICHSWWLQRKFVPV